VGLNFQEAITLATPNYGYEKRQRELAKKKKKEEKLRAKSHRAPGDTQDTQDGPDGQPADGQIQDGSADSRDGASAAPGPASGTAG
jgi:hypothetical protein